MFCLVGLAPQEGLESLTRVEAGDMKLELEENDQNHSASSNEEQHKCSFQNCQKVFEDRESLQEMMAQLGIDSGHFPPELKVEVEDEDPEDDREEASIENPPSVFSGLKGCWVSLENIKIQPENIEVEREEKEEMPTTEREGEDQLMQEQSILLKPLSNNPRKSVRSSKRDRDNAASRITTATTKKFQCLECEQSFPKYAELRQHEFNDHPASHVILGRTPRDSQQSRPDKEACSICSKTLHRRALPVHLASMHNKRNCLICKLCGFKTSQTTSLNRLKPEMRSHLQLEHDQQISSGAETESLYTSQLEDFFYEKKAKRNDPVICSICGVETNWKISNHMRFFHDDTPCKDCGMILSGEKEYKLHRRRVHAKEFLLEKIEKNKETKFICATCGKGYAVKSTYWNHLVTHTLPPYHKACEYCGEQFDKRKEYSKHYRDKHQLKTQSSSTNVKCEDCGKTFANLACLTIHLRTVHLGIKKRKKGKPIPCPTCNKIFFSNETLAYHMNVHTGAKPYKCYYCENAYQNKSNRLNHIKKSHPDLYQKQKEAVAAEGNKD